MSRFPSALLAAAMLWLAVADASAQSGGCYSDAQIRAAVQSQQAVLLSNVINQIEQRFGGKVVSSRLCPDGGRLTYIVALLVGSQVREVRVDAASGAFN